MNGLYQTGVSCSECGHRIEFGTPEDAASGGYMFSSPSPPEKCPECDEHLCLKTYSHTWPDEQGESGDV